MLHHLVREMSRQSDEGGIRRARLRKLSNRLVPEVVEPQPPDWFLCSPPCRNCS